MQKPTDKKENSPTSISRSIKFFTSAVMLSFLAACATETVNTTAPGAVGVTRSQKMSGSTAQYHAQAEADYNEMMQAAQQKGILNRDPAMVARVNRIADRLIYQTPNFRPDAKEWTWQVNTLQLDEINAFCMAGGKIAVFSGLINRLNLTDDELAAVIGHEIVHALREHVREQDRKNQRVAIASILAGVLAKDAAVMEQVQRIGSVGYTLPHSRDSEIEADVMGLELAARAGFDPRASLSLWDKMARAGGARPPEYLSTHPDPSNRQAQLQAAIAKVMPLYEAAKAQPQRKSIRTRNKN